MARKAPKNPINDIVDTVGSWLGGSRGAVTNPQVRAAMDATRAIGKVVDTATGGFGQAVVSDAQRMAASGSSTPSALYKTAAVNLGAAAAGVGAAKVVAKTGVAARVANKLTGKTVMVHGTGNPLEGTALRPVGGSPGSPDESVVFGWNPRYKGAKDTVPTNVQEYAAKTWNMSDTPQYNVVIGKGSRRAVTKVEGNPAILKSTKPVEIKAVVKADVDYETYIKNLSRELKKAGAPLKGNSNFGPVGDRVERMVRQRKYNRSNRNSPI